jgi:hypothetical protein
MQGDTTARAQVLADHYHRASEAASQRWQERNRQFLLLVGVLTLAVLLTANHKETDSLVIAFLAKLAGVKETEVDKLKESFPYVVLHGLLVVLVFYFMTDVFRLNANIIRNYAYLRGLEGEIRDELGLASDQIGFTREGKFYDSFKVRGNAALKIAYVLIVGGMLGLFLLFRITSDWPTDDFDYSRFTSWSVAADWLRKHFLLIVDIVVGGMTVVMYLAYARLSFWPPRRRAPLLDVGV